MGLVHNWFENAVDTLSLHFGICEHSFSA